MGYIFQREISNVFARRGIDEIAYTVITREVEMKAKILIEEMSHGRRVSPWASRDKTLHSHIEEKRTEQSRKTSENLEWLYNNMHPYFFITMKEEAKTIIHLAARLQDVAVVDFP